MTPLEFFQHMYPNEGGFKRDNEEWRAYVGRYGITGRMQTAKISTLSDGQKSRIVFAILCMKNHNMLLLDEPTNHLVSWVKLVGGGDGGSCVRSVSGVLCVLPVAFLAVPHSPPPRFSPFVFLAALSQHPNTLTHATKTQQTQPKKNTPHNKKTKKDIEAIDSLADAINKYDGGVVLVSHDFRLIDQVAKSIWVCEGKAVTPWSKGIREYKALLARRMKKTM